MPWTIVETIVCHSPSVAMDSTRTAPEADVAIARASVFATESAGDMQCVTAVDCSCVPSVTVGYL